MVTICADGFNGAASARSRKCALNLALYVAGVASMGPRARARGNRPILLDFPHRCSFWLQWGRERARADMNPAAVQRLPAIFASMGPRARARGNPAARMPPGRLWSASMGPRARARGNLPSRKRPRRRARRFNGAASARSRKWLPAWRKRPQSSRFNGAASARSRKYDGDFALFHRYEGFNGAASARSRKCRLPLRRRHGSASLQWGRERALAEIAYLIPYSILKDRSPLCER